MKKAAHGNRHSIDNALYDTVGEGWWQPDSPLYLIQSSLNPARIDYFKRKLIIDPNVLLQRRSALEIGCGGGLLCEEITRLGFHVTGIDPSESSLQIAAGHARANGLQIQYKSGCGEAIPCEDGSMDIVFCCDVLEHVRDVPKVISEISRVLKPGGYFFYDTLNRTYLSWLVAIKISQAWKYWAIAPDNLHVWEMFIKPGELRALLEPNHLKWQEHTGMWPNVSPMKFLSCLRKRAKGKLSYGDLGKELRMVESRRTGIMYMGYAIKTV
jgi:2-polyprenyl-6-hydroxyphenyl methylase/3-demethylubiquinone-9 3-methyltransferase